MYSCTYNNFFSVKSIVINCLFRIDRWLLPVDRFKPSTGSHRIMGGGASDPTNKHTHTDNALSLFYHIQLVLVTNPDHKIFLVIALQRELWVDYHLVSATGTTFQGERFIIIHLFSLEVLFPTSVNVAFSREFAFVVS